MSTDFQFVPTSGPLPGKSFEEQVRQAFNELGSKIDNGNEIADEAKQVAEDAKNIANQAVQTVQTAVDAANAAEEAASNAINRADGAVTTANSALSLATQAATDAKLASSTADTALNNSLAAQKSAQASQESVKKMEGQITEISGIAQAAQATANAAAGIYTITPTAQILENEDGSTSALQFDADTYLNWPQKLYIVAADDPALPQVPLNIPEYLTMPAWLMVEINGETDTVSAGPTAVFQSVWDNNANSTYTRVGTTDYTDPDNPTTTWGEWKAMGGGSGGGSFAGDIRLMPFRPAELPHGWYFANGDLYPLTSPQGTALNSLSTGYKADWGITVSGANINLPSMFYSDGRGLFLRAVDGIIRRVGSVEQDAFQGHAHTALYIDSSVASVGGTYTDFIRPKNNSSGQTLSIVSDNTNGEPRISAETRSLNIGMTPAIYLGV